MKDTDDFYEDDEPIADIAYAFARGKRLESICPICNIALPMIFRGDIHPMCLRKDKFDPVNREKTARS